MSVKIGLKISLVMTAIILSGCASPLTLPLTSKLSDGLMMNTTNGTSKEVAITIKSYVRDGEITPYLKDKVELVPMHAGYLHLENIVLSKMIYDFLNIKFMEVNKSADTKIEVTIKEFWIEQYINDSTTEQVMAAFGGITNTIMISANIVAQFEATKGGEKYNKKIIVSGEATSIYEGGNGNEVANKTASAISDANNKVLVMLNKFIDGNNL